MISYMQPCYSHMHISITSCKYFLFRVFKTRTADPCLCVFYISMRSSSVSQRANISHYNKNFSELFHDTILFPEYECIIFRPSPRTKE